MGKELDRFVEIIRRLRGPRGCPWDREQDHHSLLPCLLDEAYELVEAIEEKDSNKIREELGDLLLQVGLHAQIADDEGSFHIEDVARSINEKLIRRHPHVFGEVKVDSANQVAVNWEEIKKKEINKSVRESALDGIPPRLPALHRASKIQSRAAYVGFDWNSIDPVLDKVEEEFGEFREALQKGDHEHAEEELGDILFAMVNVARHKKISAEAALRRTIEKFTVRFQYIEKKLRETGREPAQSSLEEMDKYWEESKGFVE